MSISPSPPQRTGTRSSIRQGFRGIKQDVREGLHDVGQTIKRRMSSSLGDGGSKKKPRINRALSRVTTKATEKLFGKTPRASTEMDHMSQHMGYYHDQHVSNISPESRPESQVIVTDVERYHLYQSHMQQMQQMQQPHEAAWTIPMATDSEPTQSKAVASSSAVHGYEWAPQEDVDVSSYAPENWQQQRTVASTSPLEASPVDRGVLLGLSVTPPPDRQFVQGTWQDIHQLSGSRTVCGTHKDRFDNTVRKANELTAVVTGGELTSHGQPLSNVSPATQDATVFPLSSVTTPSPRPSEKGKQKEEPLHLQDNDPTNSEHDEDNTEKPCPWPSCPGTTKSKVFEPNRLKEHIRRGHLLPLMCDSEGCGVRKGDKNQIYRHRTAKHPGEPKKRWKEQDEDPVALKKYKVLNERGLSYERIAEICRATTIAELEEPWEHAAHASSSSNLVKTESPLSPTFGPGLGLSSNVFDQAPVPGSAHSTTFPDTLTPGFPSPATQLPNRMNGCLDGHSEFNSVLIDFVNKILVPAVDQMNLRSSPQPSRQSRYENLNTVVSHLMSAAREGLDRLERRRSGVSDTAVQQSYTDMLGTGSSSHTPNPNATPALTNTGTKTLTDRSVSYGSLNYAPQPPLGQIAGSPQTDVTEQSEWEQHSQTEILYGNNTPGAEFGEKTPVNVFHGSDPNYDGDFQAGPDRQGSFRFGEWVNPDPDSGPH